MDAKAAAARLYAMKPNAQGMTAREIANEIRCSHDRVNTFIRDAIEAGLCECAGRRPGRDICGKVKHSPVYRFKKGKA